MELLEAWMISGGYLNVGICIGAVLLIIELIVMCFGEKAKGLSNLVKACTYGIIAYMIWYYANETKNDLSILTVFSFILCCIECVDNLGDLLQGVFDFVHDLRK